jgi:DNA-directed RNA polymerase specialized sigma24 family protein
MQDMPRRSVDEEDVALSAMASFCRCVKGGKFEKLDDRSDLLKLLLTITARKVFAQRTRSGRVKRGGNRVRGESAFGVPGRGDDEQERAFGIGNVLSDEPTPELAAAVAENTQRLIDKLDDDKARQVALMKLEGYNNLEISDTLGCTRRTVERKLERIRECWSEEDPGQGPSQK